MAVQKAIAAMTRVAYIAEVTDGTTPATPSFKVFRATGEDLNVERKYAYSSELNGMRGEKNAVLAMSAGSGSVPFEFSYGTLDDFLEAALRSTWATNTLTDGNTDKPFTFEVKDESGVTDVFKEFRGSQINTLSLDFKAGEPLTGAIGLMSRLADWANTAIVGATYTAGNAESVQVGAHVGNISVAGLTPDAVTGVSLNINNNMRNLLALGSIAPVGLAAGKLEVTGSISFLLGSAEYNVLRSACDGGTTALQFEAGVAAGKTTRFELPVVQLEAPKASAPSVDGDIIATVQFRALQASTLSNSVIRVTRNL